jgi:hypothetical protein
MTFNPLPEDLPGMRAALTEKLKQGSDKMREHDIAIAEIKEANRKQDERLERIEKNTATLIDIFRAGDGTLKTAKWFGKLLIWIGSLSSAIYALWYAIINWPHKGG